MGIRLLWQPAIAVIVTDDDCIVVLWQINYLSPSPSLLVVSLCPPEMPSRTIARTVSSELPVLVFCF